jgi:hypothetical protein
MSAGARAKYSAWLSQQSPSDKTNHKSRNSLVEVVGVSKVRKDRFAVELRRVKGIELSDEELVEIVSKALEKI